MSDHPYIMHLNLAMGPPFIQVVKTRDFNGDVKSSITNIMFEAPIPRLRDAILSFKEFFDDIVIMIAFSLTLPHRVT